MFVCLFGWLVFRPLTVYGGGSPSPIMSLSLSKLSWLVAIDGSELALTNCGKLPSDNDADGPGLSSKSDSGLDAYESRDVVMGNRKSSERDSTGWGLVVCRIERNCLAKVNWFLAIVFFWFFVWFSNVQNLARCERTTFFFCNCCQFKRKNSNKKRLWNIERDMIDSIRFGWLKGVRLRSIWIRNVWTNTRYLAFWVYYVVWFLFLVLDKDILIIFVVFGLFDYMHRVLRVIKRGMTMMIYIWFWYVNKRNKWNEKHLVSNFIKILAKIFMAIFA